MKNWDNILMNIIAYSIVTLVGLLVIAVLGFILGFSVLGLMELWGGIF